MAKYSKYVAEWGEKTAKLNIEAVVADWTDDWFMIQWSDYSFRLFKIKNREKATFVFRIPITTTVGNILINRLQLENRGAMKDIGGTWRSFGEMETSEWSEIKLTKGKIGRVELYNGLGKTVNMGKIIDINEE